MATGRSSGLGRRPVGVGLVALLAAGALLAPRGLSEPEGEFTCDDRVAGACADGEGSERVLDGRLVQLERHLFERMKGLDQALHEDLARAIMEEADAARLGPQGT